MSESGSKSETPNTPQLLSFPNKPNELFSFALSIIELNGVELEKIKYLQEIDLFFEDLLFTEVFSDSSTNSKLQLERMLSGDTKLRLKFGEYET